MVDFNSQKVIINIEKIIKSFGGDSIYNIKKNIDKIRRGESTYFLDFKDYHIIKNKLRQEEYQVFKVYSDCDKVILYDQSPPKVILYEIKTKIILRHQDILGTVFSLNITDEMFGDIVVDDGKYYIFILKVIDDYFKNNFLYIKNSPIELIERPLNYLADYHHKYEEKEIIVPSLRIDVIIAKIINTTRNNVMMKIENKEIFLNYEPLVKGSHLLKENDIFSVRKYGKYKFVGIIKNTKNNNLVIKYLKYV